MKNQVVIYQAKSGAIELRGDLEKETIWGTQAQMAHIFGVNPQAITKHLKNIYEERELSERATCSKMEQVQIEGGRSVKRSVDAYNLDAIISVGYRISSTMGTKFRQWATKTLRAHIVDGFTINRARISKNYDAFAKAVAEVKALLPSGSTASTGDILELIKVFADTWVSLDAYDREKFPSKGMTKKRVQLTAEQLTAAILSLKQELVRKGEASQLFASFRSASAIESIVGNIMQTFGGKDLYPGVEEKAAHLLYFMVKNHPFTDGNKRSGAFAFVWFLEKARLLNRGKITPAALTAITLLIAESNPRDKERVTGLVTMMLRR